MKKIKYNIACINGPNLNMLGKRKPHFYGSRTLKQINATLSKKAAVHNISVTFFQSNSEGALVDFIQETRDSIDGMLINAGAFSFYGYALRDALEETGLPFVAIHLSNIYTRKDEFPEDDMIAKIAVGGVFGFKEESYYTGLELLVTSLKGNK